MGSWDTGFSSHLNSQYDHRNLVLLQLFQYDQQRKGVSSNSGSNLAQSAEIWFLTESCRLTSCQGGFESNIHYMG